jgi:D-aminopeptidase
MEENGASGGRVRFHATGLELGSLPSGPLDAITDVAGVRVGHATISRGFGPLRVGEGPVRTGVTVILPHGGDLYRRKVRAAVHTINGYGKAYGFEQVRELGFIESPIALTNTFSVGAVAEALIRCAIERDAAIGSAEGSASLNVVVGETNDGYLNDLAGLHVRYEHVRAAMDEAAASPERAAVAEGAVGAGTGTSCFGWKGGIGTASRVAPSEGGGFVVGALVQSNFGSPEALTICGVPVGQRVRPPLDSPVPQAEKGSIMIVLATDAPLSDRQIHRLCVRAGAALARTGSTLAHGSGDFVIGFSTANPVELRPGALTAQATEVVDEEAVMKWLFPAVVESTEEAILNSLFMARTTDGRDGRIRYALPIEEVAAMVSRGTGGINNPRIPARSERSKAPPSWSCGR